MPQLSKLPLLKLVVGGLAVVAPLLWLARMQWAEPAQPVAAPPPSSVVAPALERSVTERAAQPANVADTTAHAPQPSTPSVPAAHSGSQNTRSRGVTTGKSARKRSDSSARSATSAKTRGDTSSAAADERSAAVEQPVALTKPEDPQRARTTPEPEAEKPSEPERTATRAPAPRTTSEFELLFQARKAASDEPEQALRLLTEHAARYPKGQLVPEREVLVIETLRKLGRTQEAETRLKQFRASYPNSLHLQRLQH